VGADGGGYGFAKNGDTKKGFEITKCEIKTFFVSPR
jgi:hypothetical protein